MSDAVVYIRDISIVDPSVGVRGQLGLPEEVQGTEAVVDAVAGMVV